MAVIMQQLDLPIPRYIRTDHVLLSHTYTSASSSTSSRADNSKQQQEVAEVQQLSAQQQQQQVGQDAATDNTELVTGPAAEAAVATSGPAIETPTPPGKAADTSAATDSDNLPNSSSSSTGSSWAFSFCISSIHGPTCPLPMVASASVSFMGPAAALLKPREFSGQLPWQLSRTCHESLQEVQVQVTLQLVQEADADKRVHQVITWHCMVVTARAVSCDLYVVPLAVFALARRQQTMHVPRSGWQLWLQSTAVVTGVVVNSVAKRSAKLCA